MGVITCARLQELGPELALGVLPGPERSEALAHLDTCSGCRIFVEELAQAADAVLSLAPEADPRLGFESRVVERLGIRRRPRSRWYRAGAIAAVAAASAGIAASVQAAVVPSAGPAKVALPASATTVRVANFEPGPGQATGELFVHSGSPAWVFMTVDSPRSGPDGTWVVCYLVYSDGHTSRAGSFQIYDGRGSWGVALRNGVGGLRGAFIESEGGQRLASATL